KTTIDKLQIPNFKTYPQHWEFGARDFFGVWDLRFGISPEQGAWSLESMHNGGISVAHTGVHQAFQIALAANEAGLLDRFYCSVFDAPNKWGKSLRLLLGEETLINRRCDGLDPKRVEEIPGPFLINRIA